MAHQRHAGSDVEAHVRILPLPVDTLDVVGHIEGKLWTCKGIDAGQTAQAYSITQVDRDGNLLDSERSLVADNLLVATFYGNIGRILVVEG